MRFAGTKGGEKKIPESLGLAPGVVFLLCIIFFQLLHFYDAAAILDWVSRFQVLLLHCSDLAMQTILMPFFYEPLMHIT